MARITNYREAFTSILGFSLENEKVENTISWLERNGFPEKSTCYCIWKSQDKLLKYKYDSRFWTILINEVKLNGFNNKSNVFGSVNQNIIQQNRVNAYTEKSKQAKKLIEAKKREEKEIQYTLDSAMNSAIQHLRSLNQCVYFIQGVNGGPMKIGYTKGLKERLNSLQTGYPYKLIVLHVIRGVTMDLEGEIHERFEHFRLSGEWFEPRKEIFDFIESAKKDFPDYSFLAQFKKKII